MSEKKERGSAITPTRQQDFPQWYQSVIKEADLAENAPVRGCMIIKPYGFAIWEGIQKILDQQIKEEGVQNAYFPLLIPLSYIAKEADHIEGFAKECAVVTHHRLCKGDKGTLIPDPSSALTEPMIIRPTSETIIGEAMHHWVQSYRDLPLKLNQWCNVVRWEMRPRIFLRTTEFLWQEGHNAFATDQEADADARKMLAVYTRFLEDVLAIPVIPGRKTVQERFPGAMETYTVEALMQDGKALQAATSHYLGQTFAKSCAIRFLDKDGVQKEAWTTSWGMTTRTIGALIMVHGDDDGLVLPPKIAPEQAIILPIHKESDAGIVEAYARQVHHQLGEHHIRSRIDTSDLRNSDKMWKAIKKGIPIRVEVGRKECDQQRVTLIRRDQGPQEKVVVAIENVGSAVNDLLNSMQTDMLTRAQVRLKKQICHVTSLDEVRDLYAHGYAEAVDIDLHLTTSAAYADLEKEFGLTTRCIPLKEGVETVIVARAY